MQTVSRLINFFVPTHYDLSLSINRPDRTFSGTVTVHGSSTKNDAIKVHAKDLTILSATIDGKIASVSQGENDEISLAHDDLASSGPKHIVTIAFKGDITDAMHGMYPCYYEHGGDRKELIATQFESHHAREVFPCIDEPEAKATFDVVLETEDDVTVLGNMPIKRQTKQDTRLTTHFMRTPRMSTYLVAWVYGELHSQSGITKGGVEVNIWATPAQPKESLTFALSIAIRTIDFFDDYFDTPYPLPKSDHVALPDFSSGAMENWGLITYREIALLADPKTISVSSKHYIATVIAHELSHQWFGNLVTMRWWNDLWLNESFATLMEYIAIDALEPDWQVWNDFSTSESLMALRRDSIDGVQAVQVDVHHPDEISTLFDGAIVYAKGARILRMLERYVGKDAFQQGLKEYFSLHAYNNTVGDDLWEALSKASSKDIARFMNTWIRQSGYPVVRVSVDADSNAHVAQERFFVGPHATSDALWPVPLNASHSETPILLVDKQLTFLLKDTSTSLRLNVGDTAHFLTAYSPELLDHIIRDLKDGTLSEIDRLQLLHEHTLLARGGVITSADVLRLLSAYKNEGAEAVWDIIALAIGDLKKFVESDTEAEKQLKLFVASLAEHQYATLGWTQQQGESESVTKLRACIIGLMLYSENHDAITTAKRLYNSSPLEDLDPELRASIVSAAVRHADSSSVFDDLLRSYTTSHSPDIQQDIALGLTSSKNDHQIAILLASIKDSNIVRKQDVTHWFVWIIRSRYGRDKAWQWLQDNWLWVADTFKSDKSYDDFARYAASALATREQLEEYKAFFSEKLSEPALKRVITMGIRELEGKVDLIERDGPGVRNALINK